LKKDMHILEVKNVSTSYNGHTAIRNINFNVKPHEYICLVGENGSGKSTLINKIVGRKTATTGNKPGVTKQLNWIRVGKNIERLRKEKGIKQKDFIAQIQVMGCDINSTSYSKLEGQVRSVNDREIYIIAKILNVRMEELFDVEEKN